MKNQMITVRFALGTALVIILALFLFTWWMRPTQNDIGEMAVFLSITALVSLLVGYGATRLGWINQSPRLLFSILIGYFISSLLTFLNVWIMARLMFTSQHDLLLATVLLLFASGIAMIFSLFLREAWLNAWAN